MKVKQTLKKYFIPHEGNDHKPHFFREEAIAVLLIIVLAVFSVSVLTKLTIQKTGFGAAIITSVVYDLTNEARVQNNENKLAFNDTLTKAATLKANDMLANGYFAHTSPTGITPWHWFDVVGYKFFYAGENLAIDYTESADVQNAWLASPGHRANILNTKFTEIGIATITGPYQGRTATFVVETFGTPAQVAVAPVKTALPTKKITTVTKIAQAPTKNVLSASAATPVKTLSSDQNFIAVQNTDPKIAPASPDNSNITTAPHASWFSKLLLNPSAGMVRIYTILGIVIFIGLWLMILVEVRHQHPRNIVYGILILVLMAALYILYQEIFSGGLGIL